MRIWYLPFSSNKSVPTDFAKNLTLSKEPLMYTPDQSGVYMRGSFERVKFLAKSVPPYNMGYL